MTYAIAWYMEILKVRVFSPDCSRVFLIDKWAWDLYGWIPWKLHNKKYMIWKLGIWHKGATTVYTMFWHRLVIAAPDDMEVDHIDNDPLNNTFKNLRACTHKQNMRNMKSSGGTFSNYKGVSYDRRRSRQYFVAQIMLNYKNINLGRFNTAREAAIAYNEAAVKYYGEFAKLNKIEDEKAETKTSNADEDSSDGHDDTTVSPQ